MNVYLVTYEGIAVHGVTLLAYLLSERGVSVHYVGTDLTPVKSKEGLQIIPTISIEQLDLNACDALIVPGGLPHGFSALGWLGQLLRDANSRGILVGAICAATQTLAVHGLLAGRLYTSSFALSDLPQAAGSRNTKALAQRDGNIVTARGQAFLEFAVTILQALNLCSNREARLLLHRYRPSGKKIPWGLKPYIESQWK